MAVLGKTAKTVLKEFVPSAKKGADVAVKSNEPINGIPSNTAAQNSGILNKLKSFMSDAMDPFKTYNARFTKADIERMDPKLLERAEIKKIKNKDGSFSYQNADGKDIEFDKEGIATNFTWRNKAGLAFSRADGSTNVAGVAAAGAAAYGVANTGYRMASGGTVFHDSDGNFDVMGLPLI